MILTLLFDLNFQMLCMGQGRKFPFKSNWATTGFYDNNRQSYTVSIILSSLISIFKCCIWVTLDNSNHRVCEPPQVSMKIKEKVIM